MPNFKSLVYSLGMPVFAGVGDIRGIAMGRGLGKVVDPANTKVIFVDDACTTGNGSGDNWKNAITTAQAGLNKARYDTGTTDINYDDERQAFVFCAPGNYAERLAWSGKNIHLIGLGIPGTDNGTTLNPAAPSTFSFAMSGNGCEMANMCVVTATAVMGMYLPPAESCRIHDMVLLGNGAGTYGMYFDETGLKGTQVRDCIIDSYITCGIYAATAAGAYAIQGGIFGNIIGGTSVKGIDIDITTAYGFVIAHNYINGTSSASIECSSTGILVCDNWVDRQPSGTLTARDNHYSSAGA